MMYFWIMISAIVLAVVWSLYTNKNKTLGHSPDREAPLEILKRRFANGEIDEEEYEERRAVLEEDKYFT